MDLPEQTEEKPEKEKAEEKAAAEAEKKETEEIILFSHMNGEVVPLCDVKDEAFASGALGEGVAVEPSEGKLFAPVDGTVATVFPTKHAVGMVTASGTELILHIGIDTVRLEGKHFETHVEAGTSVKKGDLLVSFDMEAIKQEGYPCTTPMIVCNTDDYNSISAVADGNISVGEKIIEIKTESIG